MFLEILLNTQKNICVGVSFWRLQHKCFPVNIGKFLRTRILKNICERLLLFWWIHKLTNHCTLEVKLLKILVSFSILSVLRKRSVRHLTIVIKVYDRHSPFSLYISLILTWNYSSTILRKFSQSFKLHFKLRFIVDDIWFWICLDCQNKYEELFTCQVSIFCRHISNS